MKVIKAGKLSGIVNDAVHHCSNLRITLFFERFCNTGLMLHNRLNDNKRMF